MFIETESYKTQLHFYMFFVEIFTSLIMCGFSREGTNIKSLLTRLL